MHRLYKGGRRAQKANPRAHIHPGSFILSSILDNMLLATQKKERSGVLLPVRAFARDLYQQLYAHPQHRTATHHCEVSGTELDQLRGNNVAVRVAAIDDGLFFAQVEKFWWWMEIGSFRAAQVKSFQGFLCSAWKSPLALALLTRSDRLTQVSGSDVALIPLVHVSHQLQHI